MVDAFLDEGNFSEEERREILVVLKEDRGEEKLASFLFSSSVSVSPQEDQQVRKATQEEQIIQKGLEIQ